MGLVAAVMVLSDHPGVWVAEAVLVEVLVWLVLEVTLALTVVLVKVVDHWVAKERLFTTILVVAMVQPLVELALMRVVAAVGVA
jgi:hypothetical protein